jgi:hypothetical protein
MRFPPQFVLAALLAGMLGAQPAVSPAQTLDAPPTPALSPEQSPPAAPQVLYSQGRLKISAHNATLRDVLAMVHAQTGTQIEGPANQANERVVVELGPAPVGEVLRDLLQGSKFDYVIVGNADRPGVEKLILSIRGPAPAQSVAQAARAPEPPEEEPEVEEPAVAAPEPQPAPGQPTPGSPMPGQPMPGMQPNFPGAAIPPMGVDSNGQPIPPPGVPPDQSMQNSMPQGDPNQAQQPKSPEQLLRELQMMQQREQTQNNPNNR